MPMIGKGFKIDLMKHQIAVIMANANCAAKSLVGSAAAGAVLGTDLAWAALALIAADMPSDSAVAAAPNGPGSVPSNAEALAFETVLAAILALFAAAVSPAVAADADLLLSDGVVINHQLTTKDSCAATSINCRVCTGPRITNLSF